jgi:hypothetical protein
MSRGTKLSVHVSLPPFPYEKAYFVVFEPPRREKSLIAATIMAGPVVNGLPLESTVLPGGATAMCSSASGPEVVGVTVM